MINKRMLKFAFSGLLLAGVATSFAAGDEVAEQIVTLSNNAKITWNDFVAGINNPSTIVAPSTDIVPADDPSRTTLATAQADKEKAEQDKATAEGEVSDANTRVEKANAAVEEDGKLATALSNAKQAVTDQNKTIGEKQEAVDGYKTALETANGDLTTALGAIQTAIDNAKTLYNKNSILAEEKGETLNGYKERKEALENLKKNAQDSINNVLDKELNALRITVQKKTLKSWFNNILEHASKFEEAYDNFINYDGDEPYVNQDTIYYRLNNNSGRLYVSFIPVKELGQSTKYDSANEQQFFAYIKENNNDIELLSVFLGQTQNAEGAFVNNYTGKNDGCIAVSTFSGPGKYKQIVSNAVEALRTASSQDDFNELTYTNSYTDETEAKRINDEITLVNYWIGELNANLNGGKYTAVDKDGVQTEGEIAVGVNKQISDMQTEINNLNVTGLKNAVTRYENAQILANSTTDKSTKLTENKNDTDVDADGYTNAQIKLINDVIDERINVATAQSNLSDAEGTLKAEKDKLPGLEGAQSEAQENWDDAEKEVNAANAELTTANGKVTAAESAITAANTAIQKANDGIQAAANEIYKTYYNAITLTGDVTVTMPEGQDYLISSYGGRVRGANSPIITINGNGALFDHFSGSISNLAINGTTFLDNDGARFTNVIRWDGSLTTNPGAYYDGDANRTYYPSIGALGYAMRDNYGVNFANKGQLVHVNDFTKVFNITFNNSATQNPTAYVVVDKDGVMSNASGVVSVPVNRFAKSADADIAATDNRKTVANVYYADEDGNNVCAVANIVDNKYDNKYVDFYAPANITVGEINYNRKFQAGFNTVCLPFSLSKSYNANGNISYLCTYDREEEFVFYFSEVATDIKAYTPLLVTGKTDDFLLDNLTNITIEQSPEDMIVKGGSNENGETISYGTLKAAKADEFNGQYNSYRVYGFNNNGKKFQAVGSSATLPAFRLVVLSNLAQYQTEAQRNTPRRIALFDRNGHEVGDIVTGVETVNASELAFDIKGGNGEIIFTADNNYGEVAVYDMNGRMVTMVNVLEGTTTANVAKGFYIVNGKKVMVK